MATLPQIEDGYRVSLSLLPHVLALKSAFAPENNTSKPASDPLDALPIGHIVDNSKVVQVDLNRGVLLTSITMAFKVTFTLQNFLTTTNQMLWVLLLVLTKLDRFTVQEFLALLY